MNDVDDTLMDDILNPLWPLVDPVVRYCYIGEGRSILQKIWRRCCATRKLQQISDYSLINQVDRSQKTYREMYGAATEEDESERCLTLNARTKKEFDNLRNYIQMGSSVMLRRLVLPPNVKSVNVKDFEETIVMDDIDENMEELKGAVDDFEFMKRQLESEDEEEEEEEDSLKPQSFSGPWKPRKENMFWSREETEEVRRIFRDSITESIESNSAVPTYVIAKLRAGKWPRFTDMQVREKVRKLAKAVRSYRVR